MNPEFEIGDVVMFNKNGSFDRHQPSFEGVVMNTYVDGSIRLYAVTTEHNLSKYSWASSKKQEKGAWTFSSISKYLSLVSAADESNPISEIESII